MSGSSAPPPVSPTPVSPFPPVSPAPDGTAMVPPGPNGQSTAGPGGSTAVPLTSPAYADSGAQTLPSQLTDVQLASTQQMTSGPAQGDNPYAPQQVGGP